MQKHAYLIMAHADMPLLQVLIGMLDDERNDIYLHADKKWRDFNPNDLAVSRATLHILPNRLDGRWGHISLMEIEYALYEAASKQGIYHYYHLLSGADLPIKSQDYIHDFMSKSPYIPYISYWDHPEDTYYKVSRYTFGMKYEKSLSAYPLLDRIVGFVKRKTADLLFKVLGERVDSKAFYKGANWTSLRHEDVMHTLSNKGYMLQRLKYTRNSDEIFAQTILARKYFEPNGLDPYASKDMRLVNWKSSVISPDYFTIDDWQQIQSSDALFARKFSSSVDLEIVKIVQSHYSKAEE